MKQQNELLTQTQIAYKLGVSKSTLSKWINKNNVSSIKEIGNKKFYNETIVKQYLNSKKGNDNNKKKTFSSIELLQEEISKKQKENDALQERISKL